MEDERIVDLFLQRNESAIGETAQKYGAALKRLCFAGCGNLSDAEECVNDTYLHLWNSIPPHNPGTYFFPFCAAIARRRVIDRIRKNKTVKGNSEAVSLSEELAACIPDDADCWRRVDDRLVLTDVFNRFLGNLSVEARTVFLRRYWYFDTVAQIAEAMQWTESNVKTSLFRSREKLRKELAKEER